MPRSCVIGGCTRNSAKEPALKFLEFPKNESVRRQWVKFVETTRSDFSLSKWSLICGAHFTPDCEDPQCKMKAKLGLKCKYRLRKDAVPSLKAPNLCQVPETTKKPRMSDAYEKRERSRILQDAFTEYDVKYGPHSACSETPTPMQDAECIKRISNRSRKQDCAHSSTAPEAASQGNSGQ